MGSGGLQQRYVASGPRSYMESRSRVLQYALASQQSTRKRWMSNVIHT